MIRLIMAIAVLGILVVLGVLSSVAVYHLPSSNMMPSITPGDRALVNKVAYGFSNQSLAFGLGRNWDGAFQFRIFASPPSRGEAVIFWIPDRQRSVVGRVVGLPGEEIRVRDGRIEVNGVPAERSFIQTLFLPSRRNQQTEMTQYSETYPDGTVIDILEIDDASPLDNAGPFQIPEGHVFVLGDNRDNSIDSRSPISRGGYGSVPLSNIIGRVSE